jgi:hypoxanthine phosphoribosyltransferase
LTGDPAFDRPPLRLTGGPERARVCVMASEEQVSLRVLIPAEDVHARVATLVDQIVAELDTKRVLALGVLKGSFIFMADIVRMLHAHGVEVIVDFMKVQSYGSGTESSGKVDIKFGPSVDVAGATVLLVDDILDTGRTLKVISEHVLGMEPRLLKTCVFLDKPARRQVEFEADYVGFEVPDEFVVGYGLDWNDRYREVPGVMAIGFRPGG